MIHPLVWTPEMHDAGERSSSSLMCDPVFQKAVAFMLNTGLKSLYSISFTSAGKLPEEGGALIFPVHQSFYDPPLTYEAVSRAVDRPLFYIMNRYVSMLRTGGIWVRCGGIPIDVGGKEDNSAELAFARHAVRNNILVVYPQATRYKGVMGHVKKEVVLAWSRSRKPIWPLGIEYEDPDRMNPFRKSSVIARLGCRISYDRSCIRHLSYNVHVELARLSGFCPESVHCLDIVEEHVPYSPLVKKNIHDMRSMHSKGACLEEMAADSMFSSSHYTLRRLVSDDPLESMRSEQALLLSGTLTVLAFRILQAGKMSTELREMECCYRKVGLELDRILGKKS